MLYVMSNQSEGYEPGVYVKDGRERVANSRADAVALVFEGYKPKASEEVDHIVDAGGTTLRTFSTFDDDKEDFLP